MAGTPLVTQYPFTSRSNSKPTADEPLASLGSSTTSASPLTASAAYRLPWPSWQDLYKAFNACKREDYPFVTELASRVAEGAFMDFGTAIKNWRDTDHKAGPPRFHKKRLTGTGSFRAASGVAQIKYNGKRPSSCQASVPSSCGTRYPRAWSMKRTSSS